LFSTFAASRAPAAETNTQEIVEAIRKKHNVPAMATVVLKDGQVRDRAATGVRKLDDQTLVTTNDLWHIGSCTKSLTATLAARLVAEGKLKWTTTIAEVFPNLKGKMNPQYETVTIEQLVQNRGGVPGKPPSAAWKRAWEENGTPTEQRREFIAAVLSESPEAPPGTKMVYSNQGYAIAGAMLETVTGIPFEKLMTEKLFEPLQMKTAGFGVPGGKGKTTQPWGHAKRPLVTVPLQEDNPPAIAPAGRVHCSLDDLAKFVQLHLSNGMSVDWLKGEDITKLHTPPAGSDYA
jgi:CubicO group peptidase (beta-lactamase class C family)